MNSPSRAGTNVIATICLCFCFVHSAYPQTSSPDPTATKKESTVTSHARGTFEIKVVPLPSDDNAADGVSGRFSADKQIHGDLEGTGKGQMLAAGTGAKGSSGGYVAIERITGTLHGRSGSFVLQHSGSMSHGSMQMTITVVPDSGTGQLVGLEGKMAIKIVDKNHLYEFEFTLPEEP
jgi:hypothetical protein